MNKKYSDTKIYIWDEKQRKILKEIECYYIIMKYIFLREYLIVQVEGKFPKISIISLDNLETKKLFLLNTATFLKTFSINQDENKLYLAFLKNMKTILIYNFHSDFYYSLETKYEEIQAFEFNKKGDRLACSNKEGSYITIYSLPEKQVMVELYRGRKACQIKQMVFLNKSQYFLVHSDRETIHIYDIERKEMNFTLIPVTIVNMIQGKFLSSFAKYYITPDKFGKKREKDAFIGGNGKFQEAKVVDLEKGKLLIIKDNGDYETMDFDQDKGGWGNKLKEKEWFDGWDVVEENVKSLMKIFGAGLDKQLGISRYEKLI